MRTGCGPRWTTSWRKACDLRDVNLIVDAVALGRSNGFKRSRPRRRAPCRRADVADALPPLGYQLAVAERPDQAPGPRRQLNPRSPICAWRGGGISPPPSTGRDERHGAHVVTSGSSSCRHVVQQGRPASQRFVSQAPCSARHDEHGCSGALVRQSAAVMTRSQGTHRSRGRVRGGT